MTIAVESYSTLSKVMSSVSTSLCAYVTLTMCSEVHLEYIKVMKQVDGTLVTLKKMELKTVSALEHHALL